MAGSHTTACDLDGYAYGDITCFWGDTMARCYGTILWQDFVARCYALIL